MKKNVFCWFLIMFSFIYALSFLYIANCLSTENEPSQTKRFFHEKSISLLDKEELINHYKAYGCTYALEEIKNLDSLSDLEKESLENEVKDGEKTKEKFSIKYLIEKIARKDYCMSFYEDDWTIKKDSLLLTHSNMGNEVLNKEEVINEHISYLTKVSLLLLVSWVIILVVVILILLLFLKISSGKKEGEDIEKIKSQND